MRWYIIGLIFALGTGASSQGKPQKIVVQMTGRNCTPSYQVNGAAVPYRNLLTRLSDFIIDQGRSQDVVVFVTGSATLDQVENLRGIIGKVGYRRVTVYQLNKTADFASKLPEPTAVEWKRISELISP
jgi:hypothetical protein